MEVLAEHATRIGTSGFTIINNIYTNEEIKNIITAIEQADANKEHFRRSADLFAIRRFLKEVPGVHSLVFTEKLLQVIRTIFGPDYFVVKSIYFDKPETSNWYVAYHQDLTISVDKKVEIEGFGPWTKKLDQFAVQPPPEILENIFTIRIHLDPTNAENGALRVVEGSHLKKVRRSGDIDRSIENENTCNVGKGGVMIMKPLLLHSSGRSTNGQRRRVVHIEFSNEELPAQMSWSERTAINCDQLTIASL